MAFQGKQIFSHQNVWRSAGQPRKALRRFPVPIPVPISAHSARCAENEGLGAACNSWHERVVWLSPRRDAGCPLCGRHGLFHWLLVV